MENREKQLQELKKEYQDIHMSEEQLLQMKQKISQAKQENSRQGSNAAHSSVSHRRSITRRCGIAAAAAAASSGHLTEHLCFRCLRNESGSCALQAC